MMGPIVVKVGGSLFNLPDLGVRLKAWLKTLPCGKVILIAGGGAAADVIRAMDRIHRFGEEKSHWLALESLALTTSLLRALAPPSLAVQDLHAFACWDEGRPGSLPHRWDVTSDSLAARVCEVKGTGELILLKSVTIPPEIDWTEASRRGYVDAFFPTMVARGIKVRAVNFREWQP
jgi:aspartokinase-like uncharacterized kinase